MFVADWFHISAQFLGTWVTLEPRVPLAPAINEERQTPRISVAASVDQCLAGLTALKLPPHAYVYRASGPIRHLDTDTPARAVPDWEQSEEAWILTPQQFRYVGKISCESVAAVDLCSRMMVGGGISWCWLDEEEPPRASI